MPYAARRIRSCLPIVIALAAVEPLAAQVESSALIVRVTAAPEGTPLGGAQVIVQGLSIGGVTRSDGTLQLQGLPPGSLEMEVRHLGFTTERAEVTLVAGETSNVHFGMLVAPIELSEVRVQTRHRLDGTGFHQRKATGSGTFFTREQIQRRRPRALSDLMRQVAGAHVHQTQPGLSSAGFRGSRSSSCPVQFFVDGTLTASFSIDEVVPDDVEGLEIYRGAAAIPAQYNKGTAICGVILIWTRTR
jgi:hypothetical protein